MRTAAGHKGDQGRTVQWGGFRLYWITCEALIPVRNLSDYSGHGGAHLESCTKRLRLLHMRLSLKSIQMMMGCVQSRGEEGGMESPTIIKFQFSHSKRKKFELA